MLLQLREPETFGKLKLKKFLKGIVKGIKKFGLAPMRHSFLSLVLMNVHHFASRMKKQIETGKEGALKSKWEKLGGSYAELKKVINSGAKKKGFLEPAMMPTITFERLCELNGQFSEDETVVLREEETLGAIQLAAVLAAATSIIVALKPFLAKQGNNPEDQSPDVTDPAITGSLNPSAAVDPTSPANEEKFDKQPVSSTGGVGGIDFKKLLIPGAIGIGALLILPRLMKK